MTPMLQLILADDETAQLLQRFDELAALLAELGNGSPPDRSSFERGLKEKNTVELAAGPVQLVATTDIKEAERRFRRAADAVMLLDVFWHGVRLGFQLCESLKPVRQEPLPNGIVLLKSTIGQAEVESFCHQFGARLPICNSLVRNELRSDIQPLVVNASATDQSAVWPEQQVRLALLLQAEAQFARHAAAFRSDRAFVDTLDEFERSTSFFGCYRSAPSRDLYRRHLASAYGLWPGLARPKLRAKVANRDDYLAWLRGAFPAIAATLREELPNPLILTGTPEVKTSTLEFPGGQGPLDLAWAYRHAIGKFRPDDAGEMKWQENTPELFRRLTTTGQESEAAFYFFLRFPKLTVMDLAFAVIPDGGPAKDWLNALVQKIKPSNLEKVLGATEPDAVASIDGADWAELGEQIELDDIWSPARGLDTEAAAAVVGSLATESRTLSLGERELARLQTNRLVEKLSAPVTVFSGAIDDTGRVSFPSSSRFELDEVTWMLGNRHLIQHPIVYADRVSSEAPIDGIIARLQHDCFNPQALQQMAALSDPELDRLLRHMQALRVPTGMVGKPTELASIELRARNVSWHEREKREAAALPLRLVEVSLLEQVRWALALHQTRIEVYAYAVPLYFADYHRQNIEPEDRAAKSAGNQRRLLSQQAKLYLDRLRRRCGALWRQRGWGYLVRPNLPTLSLPRSKLGLFKLDEAERAFVREACLRRALSSPAMARILEQAAGVRVPIVAAAGKELRKAIDNAVDALGNDVSVQEQVIAYLQEVFAKGGDSWQGASADGRDYAMETEPIDSDENVSLAAEDDLDGREAATGMQLLGRLKARHAELLLAAGGALVAFDPLSGEWSNDSLLDRITRFIQREASDTVANPFLKYSPGHHFGDQTLTEADYRNFLGELPVWFRCGWIPPADDQWMEPDSADADASMWRKIKRSISSGRMVSLDASSNRKVRT